MTLLSPAHFAALAATALLTLLALGALVGALASPCLASLAALLRGCLARRTWDHSDLGPWLLPCHATRDVARRWRAFL